MIGLTTLTAAWLSLAPPIELTLVDDDAATTVRTYDQTLVAVREATVATNIDPGQGAAKLARTLDDLLDYAPTLAADPSGRELHLMGRLTLARAALVRGAEHEARAIVDELLTAMLVSGELDELDVDKLGPRLDALVRERAAAAELASLTRLRVDCRGDCSVYVDGREVDYALASGAGAPLTRGSHEVWIEAEDREPLRELIEVERLAELHELSYGSPEPPPPRVIADPGDDSGAIAPIDAPPRVAPRWAEIGIIGVGVAGTGVGAALIAIHGSCIGGGSRTGADACANIRNTQGAGITGMTLGLTAALTGTIMLAVDERRRQRK